MINFNLRRQTGVLNSKDLFQISNFINSPLKSDHEISEKSHSSYKSHRKNNEQKIENPYLLKITQSNNIEKKRYSINYQKNLIESNFKTMKSPVKPTMKNIVQKVVSDEEFISKEFSSFKIERILKPGESYGETGIEFMTKK